MGFGIGIGLSGKLDNVTRLYMQKQQREDALMAAKAARTAKEIDDADKRLSLIKNSVGRSGLHPFLQDKADVYMHEFLNEVDQKSIDNPLYGKSNEAKNKGIEVASYYKDLKEESKQLYEAEELSRQPNKYYTTDAFLNIYNQPKERQAAAYESFKNGTKFNIQQAVIPDLPKEQIYKDLKLTYPIDTKAGNVVERSTLNKDATRLNTGNPIFDIQIVPTEAGLKKWAYDYYENHKSMLGRFDNVVDFYENIKDNNVLTSETRSGRKDVNYNKNYSFGGGNTSNSMYLIYPLDENGGSFGFSKTGANTQTSDKVFKHDMYDENGVKLVDAMTGKPIEEVKGNLETAEKRNGKLYVGIRTELPKILKFDDGTSYDSGKKESKLVYMPLDEKGKGHVWAATNDGKKGGILPFGLTLSDKSRITTAEQTEQPKKGNTKVSTGKVKPMTKEEIAKLKKGN